MKKNVLIFYISRFSGHFHAASAIETALNMSGRNIQVKKINALDYTNPILGKILNRAYIEIIKKKPELWGHIYDNPEFLKRTKTAREVLHRYNMSKIRKLIEKEKPDVVFCTQAFPCGMVADYKRSKNSQLKLIGVLTDHAPHSYWIYDEVDKYVVPSKDIIQKLVKKNVPEKKILPLGIPIDPKYLKRYSKKEVIKKFGFREDAPVILVMGGTQGLGAMEDVVKSVVNDKEHAYQLIIVSGNNKRLRRKLAKYERANPLRVKILPYVDNIDELMDGADMIVTKAGGMTTSEAMAKELPILIVKPIPGHEKMNADYLAEKGAAIEVKDIREVPKTLNVVFKSRNMLKIMKDACREIAKPNSAIDVAKLA